jgi:hypothetical protein
VERFRTVPLGVPVIHPPSDRGGAATPWNVLDLARKVQPCRNYASASGLLQPPIGARSCGSFAWLFHARSWPLLRSRYREPATVRPARLVRLLGVATDVRAVLDVCTVGAGLLHQRYRIAA